MAKTGKSTDRSILRLLFWEGLALAGFLHLLAHPLANEFWGWLFFYNSLTFLVAYPILYVYRWKMTGGCLGMVLWPLSFFLDWVLAGCFYLWTAYAFLVLGSPFYGAFLNHWIILGILSLFVYFPLVQPVWGIGLKYHPFGDLVRLSVAGFLGGILGYALGWTGGNLLEPILGGGDGRFLFWLGTLFSGMALATLYGRKGLEK